MNKLTLFLILTIPSLIFSQTYSLDKAEIYTANNEVEETLNTANNILCIISKIKAEQFIDKGPYKAQVFDSRCDVAGARADAQAAAQGGNNNNNNNNNEVELASDMIVDVKSAFSEVLQQDYLEVKSWFYQKGDYSEAQESYEGMWDAQPDQLIYALTKVWSGATNEDPNGDIELDFVVESNCQNAPYQSDEEARAAATELGLSEGQDAWYRHMDKFWKCMPPGFQMGSGKLDTMDDKVLFVGPQGRSILLTDNANGRDGLWQVNWWECIIDNKFIDYQDREAAGCGDMDPRNPQTYAVDATYGFSFDETTKASCKKLVKATRRIGQDNAEDTFSDITEEWKNIDWDLGNYPWLAEGGPAQGLTEVCESTDANEAKLAVWEYGLYTAADDLRYDMKNPGFELKSEEEFTSPYDEDRTESIYAWADYWGTHVDENKRENVTDATVFKKVNSDDTNSYYLKQRKISIRKMKVDKVSLNSLSGVELNLHIEWDRTETGVNCWWNDFKSYGGGTILKDDDMDNNGNGEDDRCNIERWRDLGLPVDLTDENGNPYNIFLGYWDAAYASGGSTPVASFVFDKAVVEVNNRWVEEVDITPFTFTPSEYVEVWDDDRNSSNGYEVWRNLWAHGRGQGYEIKGDALQAPASDLVNRRTEKDISVSELAGKTLGCIERCLSGEGMTAYFNAALTLINAGTADNPGQGDVPTPYTSPAIIAGTDTLPTGPYVRAGTDKGNWTQEGVMSTEVVTYEVAGDSLAVSNTGSAKTPLALPAQMYELNDPWNKFEQNICVVQPNGVDKECWGMKNHMTLFDMDKKAEVECEKTVDTDYDGTPDEYERHSDSTVQNNRNVYFRYCNSKLWKMTEFYEIHFDPWVNYQVFDGSGSDASLVEISRPEAVTVVLPDTEKFGSDAGRKKTLEYGGFGRLWGFEWTNFNVKTWKDLGEYLDWDSLSETDRQNVRGFPTYVIPDGTEIIGEDGETKLKSKFLRGEYYLKPLDAASFNNLYTTNPAGLENQQANVYDSAFIGPAPEASTMLNDGNACVDHGEIMDACITFTVDGTTPGG
jgi:hypothetical protein